MAARLRPDVLAGEHVAIEAVRDVAVALAGAADYRTGRDCRPGNGPLTAAAGYSERQVQRVRRALAQLGYLIETLSCANGHDVAGAERGSTCPEAGCGRNLSGGKNYVSLAQRLALWRAGSKARALAARFTLTVPRDPQPATAPVDDGDLSVLGSSGTSARAIRWSLRRRNHMDERSAPSQPRARPRPSPTLGQIKAHRLAAAVQRGVSWLTDVSPRRLTCLHKFAAQRWTEGDVITVIHDVLRARGWTVPAELSAEHDPAGQRRAGYLASLLRDVDPNDRPGALDEAREAAQARERYRWELAHGRECEHGKRAGHLPHPAHGRPACPFCRLVRN